MDKYVYLLLSLGFLVPALFIVWRAKDFRSTLLMIGLLGGLLGLLAEWFYFVDYWRPLTTLGDTVSSPEDFIFGASIAVIAAGAYDAIRKKFPVGYDASRVIQLALIAIGGIVYMVVATKLLGVNSMIATYVGFIVLIIAFYVTAGVEIMKRSLITGLVLVAIMIVVYVPLFSLVASSGYIEETFLLSDTTGNPTLFGLIPAFELYWYLLWGMIQGIVMPYAFTYEQPN